MNIDTDVAVIGSGFSAVALSLNLVELLPPTANVSLVGRSDRQGRGIAYSTTADCHLLNVPAGRMSLFADRPNHFVRWLAEHGHPWTSDDFVPRRVYGSYVGDCLEAARRRTANRAALSLVDAEALGAEAAGDGGLLFRLDDGRTLSSRVGALCTGVGTGRLPVCVDAVAEDALPLVIRDPWAEAWWEKLSQDADVAFIGTGPTMVDQCLMLKRRGFAGTMHAVSRRGLMPHAHLAQRADPVDPVLVPGQAAVSEMLRLLRAQAAQASDWRAVMDGLRPVTQALWKGMDGAQRARFLRHASAFWNVHRHRMAPSVASEIDALRRSGQLVIHRGRPTAIRGDREGLVIEVGGRTNVALQAGMVVNCAGLERCTLTASPFLSDLARTGLLQPDPLCLGIAVDEQSAVICADGHAETSLYALGPLTAGRHWEVTAVPDIRVQARSVAERIGAHVRHGERKAAEPA